MTFDPRRRPNVIPWPPVILFALAAAAFSFGAMFPILPPPGSVIWLRAVGAMVCAGGIGLDLWAIRTMYRHRTTVLPNRAVNRLVTSGPFKFSRNPIYVGNTTLLTGLAITLANPLFLIAAVLNVILVNKLAIEREETHLANSFKDTWHEYAARVPRWIGPIRRL